MKKYKIQVSLKKDISDGLDVGTELIDTASKHLPAIGVVSEEGEERIIELFNCKCSRSVKNDIVYDVGNFLSILWFGFGMPVDADKVFLVKIIK